MRTKFDWTTELERWLEPFLSRLARKARRRMCPLYIAGLIVGGDENPRVNGAQSVPKSRSSPHRAALGSVGLRRRESSRRLGAQGWLSGNPL